jgi:hypothetical protein
MTGPEQTRDPSAARTMAKPRPDPAGTTPVHVPRVGNSALAALLGSTSDPGPARDAPGAMSGSTGWAQLIAHRILQQPRSPNPFDPFDAVLRDELRKPRPPQPPPAPEPVVPGDAAQQARVFRLTPWEVFERPEISGAIEKLAEQVEAFERTAHPSATGVKERNVERWRERFEQSLEYILAVRETRRDPAKPKVTVTARKQFMRRLELKEAELAKQFQGEDLVAKVTAARAELAREWERIVDEAARGFVQVAANEAQLMTTPNRPRPAQVLGLPADMEPTMTSDDAPKQVEKGAKPVAASVVKYMVAVQAESGDLAVAENYSGHELANAHFPGIVVGHYSYDVHPTIAQDPATGFYERTKMVRYFLAMERAAQKTNIEWMAFYNDASVVKEVNDTLGVGHVAFSGGGGGGTFHHGPAPYILHVHVNIMPKDLEARFRVGRSLAAIKQVVADFLAGMGARF